MLTLSNITVLRGAKVLLKDTSLTGNLGDRIGLVGNNGSGKSSLFAVLRGELVVDAGNTEWPPGWRMAHVAQETPGLPDAAVDYVLQGDAITWGLLQESETTTDLDRLGHLQTELEDADAYTARSRAEALLAGLGFKQSDMSRPVAEFSGGWRMRLNLARALMAPSEMLLLDEPTNHLDLDAILWLERWLTQYRGLLMVISHDREFLDGVVNSIVHIEFQKLNRYTGTYSSFELARALRMSQQQAAFSRQQEHISKLEGFISRFKAKASKAKQAQSRVKMLERLERVAPLLASNPVAFDFETPERTPDPLLTLEGVDCGYGENQILQNVTLTVRSGSRIGLLGINGAGKSTLVKTLATEIAPLAGVVRPAKWLEVGYFAQHQLDMLDMDATPLTHMRRVDGQAREQELRNYLGRFHFRGDMCTSLVRPFSGGEKARLALAMIVYKKPNLLLLDEPTNHLDLETREALTAALAEYEGTLILVSHDRHLLRAAADELWLVADGSVQEFEGDLDDYRSWMNEARRTQRSNDKLKAEKIKAASAPPVCVAAVTVAPEIKVDRKEDRKTTAAERIRLAELKKPLVQQLARIEKKMTELQNTLNTLNTQIADPKLYENADGIKIAQISQDQAYAARELSTLEGQWLELQEQIEAIATG